MELRSSTIVTGLWNLCDDVIYNRQKVQLKKLLECKTNMCIFVHPSDEEFIWKHRDKVNTRVITKTLEEFKIWFSFNSIVEKIQLNLCSTQHKLYAPIMMSKMFMLHDITITNPFNSEYFYWIDTTIDINANQLLDKLAQLTNYVDKPIMLAYPNNGHFKLNRFILKKICDIDNIKYICRGIIFGGKINMISELNIMYYDYLDRTLNDNLILTDECIFSIINEICPNLIYTFKLCDKDNINPFYDLLKCNIEMFPEMLRINEKCTLEKSKNQFSEIKANLYILTYNFPEQLTHLLLSLTKSDINFLNKTKKYLLNNSTDIGTFEKYDKLCESYSFEQIKKNNIGICGARQFIAEHFEQSDADYYIFFEDDMTLCTKDQNTVCASGFRTWTPDLYNNSLNIMIKENYDYLKINFTEFYGGNNVQWAWYNVPDNIRHKYFPNKKDKPISGFDPNPPLTQFTYIRQHNNLSYIEGDIYYCNWPMWFNKEGNKKVFLEPKLAHPYEQTWMSSVFQKQKNNLIRAALLLLSPVNHNRIHHYDGAERKEN